MTEVLLFFCIYLALGVIYVEYQMRKIDKYVELYETDPSKLDNDKLEKLERLRNTVNGLPSDDNLRKRTLAVIKVILVLIWLPVAISGLVIKIKKFLNHGKEKKDEPSGSLE